MRRAYFPKVNDKGNAGQNFLFVKQKSRAVSPAIPFSCKKFFPLTFGFFLCDATPPKGKIYMLRIRKEFRPKFLPRILVS